MIIGTPEIKPFPVESFHVFSTAEQLKISKIAAINKKIIGDDGKLCSLPIRIGLFFDGTNNNLNRDRYGKRIGIIDSKTKKPASIKSKTMTPEECSDSNVARLFLAYAPDKGAEGYFRVYIPGLGTPFEIIGEDTESSDGKAFASGGRQRIVWALLQVINAISIAVTEENLYDQALTGDLVRKYENEVGNTERTDDEQVIHTTHVSWFAEKIESLKKKIKLVSKPSIPSLTLDVFGFSRGAAEAVSFCHYFDELLINNKFSGIAAEINFLGVFDTVATVKISASVAQTLPLPDILADGHWGWASKLLKPLPDCVKQGRHFIAAHEQRMNFPVTVLEGGGDFRQMYFPGVHSDVGGGYGPGESGKGRGSQAAMLSQIPLAYMYREARLSGVPLQPFSELEASLRDDFEVDSKLASAWQAYSAALNGEGFLVMKHMQLYYRWRALRLNTLESTDSFKAADPQSQQDLRDANRMLIADISALKIRQAPPNNMENNDASDSLSNNDRKSISQWQYMRVKNWTGLGKWEQWALPIFEKKSPMPADLLRFFDDYIHDSIAGFYLAGEMSEFDKRTKVASVMAAKNPVKLNDFDKRVHTLTLEVRAAQKKKENGEELNEREQKLVDDAEFGTPFPIMSDEDTADMRNVLIMTQTSSRREGGGYFLPRGYFPHVGFFFFRRSKHEKQINQQPEKEHSAKTASKQEELVGVWIDDGTVHLQVPKGEFAGEVNTERASAIA